MIQIPFATWNPIRNCPGLPFVHGSPRRGVLHTTEGGYTYRPRSDGTYLSATPPQVTVATNGVFQHVDLALGAYALKNLPGGVETNRQGVIQVEVCGRAADAPSWPDELYANLERTMRSIEDLTGVRATPYDGFHAYPPPPGTLGREPWRMSYAAWNIFDGWCGHQHVPENDHGDPGAVRLDLLFPKTKPPTVEVAPMFDPPLAIRMVAMCAGPNGQGALALGDDGGVFISPDAPVVVPPGWVIGPNGQSYFTGRTPATIRCIDASHWVVTATSGENYDYPHAPG